MSGGRTESYMFNAGPAVPLFNEETALGIPVTVIHCDIDKAAGLISQARTLEIGSKIFVLNMGVPIKILVLVQWMMLLTQKELCF